MKARRASSVQGQATDWMAKELGLDSQQGEEIFLFSMAFRLVVGGSPSLLYNGYWGLFPWGYRSRYLRDKRKKFT
jgi:hypothetical protein